MRGWYYPYYDCTHSDTEETEVSVDEFIEMERADFHRQWFVYIREYDEGENEY